jgi:hypothetical protein
MTEEIKNDYKADEPKIHNDGSIRNLLKGLFSPKVNMDQIKNEIDSENWLTKSWQEIRQGIGIKLNKVKNPSIILKALGDETVIRYFNALSGKDKPYTFVLPVEKKDLLEYLRFETEEAPAPFIIKMLKKPLTAAGINILITHAKWTPVFISNIRGKVGEERLKSVLAQVRRDFPDAADAIEYILFNEGRRKILQDAEILWQKGNNDGHTKKIEECRNTDNSFFEELTKRIG